MRPAPRCPPRRARVFQAAVRNAHFSRVSERYRATKTGLTYRTASAPLRCFYPSRIGSHWTPAAEPSRHLCNAGYRPRIAGTSASPGARDRPPPQWPRSPDAHGTGVHTPSNSTAIHARQIPAGSPCKRSETHRPAEADHSSQRPPRKAGDRRQRHRDTGSNRTGRRLTVTVTTPPSRLRIGRSARAIDLRPRQAHLQPRRVPCPGFATRSGSRLKRLGSARGAPFMVGSSGLGPVR